MQIQPPVDSNSEGEKMSSNPQTPKQNKQIDIEKKNSEQDKQPNSPQYQAHAAQFNSSGGKKSRY